MTSSRLRRKPRGRGLRFCRRGGNAFLLAVALWAGFGPLAPGVAATADWIVVDPNSGLAISGFDPVAYFTDGAALPGKGEFEQSFGGTVWRFRSAGNLAAFAANPDVYMPRFGGYDPVRVAHGVSVAGNPRLWLINGERLYLFYTPEDRTEFANDADQVSATADSEWSRIHQRIVPTVP